MVYRGGASPGVVLDAYDLALRNDPTFQAAIRRVRPVKRIADQAGGVAAESVVELQQFAQRVEVTAGDVTSDRDYRSYASTLTLQQPTAGLRSLRAVSPRHGPGADGR